MLLCFSSCKVEELDRFRPVTGIQEGAELSPYIAQDELLQQLLQEQPEQAARLLHTRTGRASRTPRPHRCVGTDGTDGMDRADWSYWT